MPKLQLSYEKFMHLTVTAVAVAMVLYHMWIILVGPSEAIIFRGTHLMFALALCFLIYGTKTGLIRPIPTILDYVWLAAGIGSVLHLFINYDYVVTRIYYIDDLSWADMIWGAILIVTVTEATRRCVDVALPITSIVFLAYGLFIARLEPERLIDQLYMTTEGIFGQALAVSASFVIIFVVFGSFMEKTGVGQLFMDFAMALTGHTAGGPGKVSVVSSSLFGTISGSAVANVMVDGPISIPLMKRSGFKPHFAAGVEATASTGGQIMPPIMGAAAFVMAEFLAVPYGQIVIWAVIPAILYYVACFAAVHFEAKRQGIHGVPRAELPRMRIVMAERGHLFLPIVILLVVMYSGYSAPLAALAGTLACFPVAALRKSTRVNVRWKNVVDAMVEGAKNSLAVALACASAGIMIGVVTLSGLGIVFTQWVVGLSQDYLFIALVMTMLAAIVLGTGLPTTPSYILLTALLIPAIMKLGVIEPAAHMFAFYFAVLSAITPPVALAVFAAAGLAKADMWRFRLGGDENRRRGLHRAVHVRLSACVADDRHLARHYPSVRHLLYRHRALRGRSPRLFHHACTLLAASVAARRRDVPGVSRRLERYHWDCAGRHCDRLPTNRTPCGKARVRKANTMTQRKKPEDLRSHRWLGVSDMRSFGHRSRLRQIGYDADDWTGKPVIGIINTWSDINPCHTHLRSRAENVKRGVLQAGGFPIELPAMSLSETMVKPTTMMYRNFLAMETEELLRSHPLDGAVLMGGCDKTTPGLVMGAISMGLPAIYIPAGPMLRGNWRGNYLGSGSDVWKYWTEKSAGNITDDDWNEIEGGIARSFGTCMVMGTAATMMAITEALGLALPGSSSIPAADANHPRMCGVAGRRIVEMVWEDLTPDKILTPAAFDNAIKVHMAMGGSTNAIIHVVAMARRAGIPVDMERFDELSREIPVLANVRPSGKYLMEDFFYAGGLRAMMQGLKSKLDLGCMTVTGKTIGDNIEGAQVHIPDVIHGLNDPVYGEGATAVLKGNLAPNGCVIKPAAADQRFLKHRGKVIAFEDYNHMMREIERDDLDVTRDHILVLKNAGPKGGPGMPEWGMLPIPKRLLAGRRARHDPHLRRPYERNQLRRLHPARRAGKLRRRAARLRADRR